MHMELVGRVRDVRELGTRPAKVVVLAGDRGVGKSEVLRAGQDQSTIALAPAPMIMRHAPGALQRGLLECLAAAIAEVIEDQSTAERVGRAIIAAAGRVADVQLKDLASVNRLGYSGVSRKPRPIQEKLGDRSAGAQVRLPFEGLPGFAPLRKLYPTHATTIGKKCQIRSTVVSYNEMYSYTWRSIKTY